MEHNGQGVNRGLNIGESLSGQGLSHELHQHFKQKAILGCDLSCITDAQ